MKTIQLLSHLVSDKEKKCQHSNGFHMHINPYSEQTQYRFPPAAWMCNEGCGFWVPFDPDFAGTIHVVTEPGDNLDINSEMFWGNIYVGLGGFAYTPDKEGKIVTFSRSKING